MHGYPDWFMWLVMTVYSLFYILPAAVAVVVIWQIVRRFKK